MHSTLRAIAPREAAKWSTYALVLLFAPGSLIVLPLVLAARWWAAARRRACASGAVVAPRSSLLLIERRD